MLELCLHESVASGEIVLETADRTLFGDPGYTIVRCTVFSLKVNIVDCLTVESHMQFIVTLCANVDISVTCVLRVDFGQGGQLPSTTQVTVQE